MPLQTPQVIEPQHYIRHKLYADKRSSITRYADLVVGSTSLIQLLKYEVITSLFGLLPGALGLFLRRCFYPRLFKQVGKGVVFGRNLVIRNASKITLGERVIIDDDALLDARGAGEEGIVIRDEVIINRGVSIKAKVGGVSIGSRTDIGAQSSIISQGGIRIGEGVAFGGDCKIGGGLVQLESVAAESQTEQAQDTATTPQSHQHMTKGPVYIESDSVFGWGVTVMDGVRIGHGCVVDAGLVVKEDIPDNSVVTTPHRLMLLPRVSPSPSGTHVQKPEAIVPWEVESAANQDDDFPAVQDPEPEIQARITNAVFRAIQVINEQLPPEKRLANTYDTVLWGPDAGLDSLGLVNLIVAVEEGITEEFDISISLTNYTSASEPDMSFLTVGSFITYVSSFVEKTSADIRK